SRRTEVITHNVVGSLRGSSDDWVIIGSHHDGPWVSAVEDSSGIALVLAQAEYWSAVPAEDRPHNLRFLMTSGHMTHGAGTAAFIAGHGDLLPSVVLEVHLEHTARECRGENGKLVPTEDPEVRWWFTSRNPTLVDAVEDAVHAEDLGRSLIVPPDVFGPHPTTDGGFFHLEGVPLVNFLTAPMYLFDSQDTIDKIHEASLEPVTRAAVRIIASTRGVSAGAMRDGVERDRTNA
ncbi:MAG: M28 family peptidase, partial [Actinomycetota bacterium]